jgi:hypothetical protein
MLLRHCCLVLSSLKGLRSFLLDDRSLAYVNFRFLRSPHLSPLKWEYINLTGDYQWRKDAGLRNRKLRPLRVGNKA